MTFELNNRNRVFDIYFFQVVFNINFNLFFVHVGADVEGLVGSGNGNFEVFRVIADFRTVFGGNEHADVFGDLSCRVYFEVIGVEAEFVEVVFEGLECKK